MPRSGKSSHGNVLNLQTSNVILHKVWLLKSVIFNKGLECINTVLENFKNKRQLAYCRSIIFILFQMQLKARGATG